MLCCRRMNRADKSKPRRRAARPGSTPPAPERGATARKDATSIAIAVSLIAVATAALYARVASFPFIVNYDDSLYVTDNPHVRTGLSLANLRWALTGVCAGNWHPLTMLSHMLDVQLFGVTPGGPHLVNAALHVVNALLVFWVLYK